MKKKRPKARGPKPKTPERKKEPQVVVRVVPAMKVALEVYAERRLANVSTVATEWFLRGLTEAGLWPLPDEFNSRVEALISED